MHISSSISFYMVFYVYILVMANIVVIGMV